MYTLPTFSRRAVYSVQEFCEAHDITKVLFYKMLKSGNGPRIMKVGTRTLISLDAAAEWRRACEENARLRAPRGG